VESELKKRLMTSDPSTLLKQNLDSLNLPSQLDGLFSEKVAIYETMRHIEQDMNEFMNQKLLSIKEDLL
jgi:hypothetical protein